MVQLLVSNRADIDSEDNRKVSSLMTAFRKGHVKVVKWLVRHVTQFPSDKECARYITTVTDKVCIYYASVRVTLRLIHVIVNFDYSAVIKRFFW